jgi:hypothetical protein
MSARQAGAPAPTGVRPAGSCLLEVTALSQAETESRPTQRFTLNTDGQRHPAINLAAGYSVVAGVTSTVLGLLSAAHIVGSVLGVSAFLIGLGAQMASVTTYQRCVIVTGITAAFVGMGLGIAHGGFM